MTLPVGPCRSNPHRSPEEFRDFPTPFLSKFSQTHILGRTEENQQQNGEKADALWALSSFFLHNNALL